MVVANAVLVNVIHGEAAGLPVMLTIACTLNGAVTRSLNNSEDDGLRLDRVMFYGKNTKRVMDENGGIVS